MAQEQRAVEDLPPADVAKLDIKQKQAVYHDWEAATYDDKFSISYDERTVTYARDRFRKVVPEGRFDDVLEIGAGTGFFTINLAQAGCLGTNLHVSDISPGMLDVCVRNAREHGVTVIAEVGDAEALPYPDATFDLVIGHAFLHHLPDPEKALAEAHRVLRPGGTIVIAGEPTRWGDRIATVVKRNAYRGFLAATVLPPLRKLRRPPIGERYSDVEAVVAALEHEVDLHTFPPVEVREMARRVGFADAEVVTEELVSNWWGWSMRTVEALLKPGTWGMGWAMTAYRGYLALNLLDEKVLGHVVPKRFFYNLILHGTKPDDGPAT